MARIKLRNTLLCSQRDGQLYHRPCGTRRLFPFPSSPLFATFFVWVVGGTVDSLTRPSQSLSCGSPLSSPAPASAVLPIERDGGDRPRGHGCPGPAGTEQRPQQRPPVCTSSSLAESWHACRSVAFVALIMTSRHLPPSAAPSLEAVGRGNAIGRCRLGESARRSLLLYTPTGLR